MLRELFLKSVNRFTNSVCSCANTFLIVIFSHTKLFPASSTAFLQLGKWSSFFSSICLINSFSFISNDLTSEYMSQINLFFPCKRLLSWFSSLVKSVKKPRSIIHCLLVSSSTGFPFISMKFPISFLKSKNRSKTAPRLSHLTSQ
ncbi:hypothetical protein JYU34_022119 [Plutella xylostella]|uniref:Uncharacterized protein n=1 Tax=Plutella xylostella TaxID=51655 RepID=A0ABQ7PQ87_PLUXY|nr:hypothetical protein JYU34_022119 [Plutella xylostella]